MAIPPPGTGEPARVTRIRLIVVILGGYAVGQFIANISAWDALDRVWVSAVVREASGSPDSPTIEVTALSDTFAGVGEPDPREWLRDALIGILEAL